MTDSLVRTHGYDGYPAVLVVVDMQNDFVTGALGTEDARAVVPKVVDRVKEVYKHNTTTVIYTRDTHYDQNYKIYPDAKENRPSVDSHPSLCVRSYKNTLEGKYLPIPHCIVGTQGHAIIPELVALQQEYDFQQSIVVDKSTYGATHLPWVVEHYHYLYNKGAPIEILGLVTDCCVLANAILLRNALPDYKIRINSQCCAGSTPQMHQAALDILKLHQIEII